jgi:hypothetical protein
LRLTDALLELGASSEQDLGAEVEARWELVERAWEARFGAHEKLFVAYDEPTESLVSALLGKRRPWRTSVRPALNGYQRGHCFYCYRSISVRADGEDGSDVDHLLPFSSAVRGAAVDVDGVWNLVLACGPCNSAKWAFLPARRYLDQLAARNNWLVQSNHPLRETIMATTGATAAQRDSCYADAYQAVSEVAEGPWEVPAVGPFPFVEHLGEA